MSQDENVNKDASKDVDEQAFGQLIAGFDTETAEVGTPEERAEKHASECSRRKRAEETAQTQAMVDKRAELLRAARGRTERRDAAHRELMSKRAVPVAVPVKAVKPVKTAKKVEPATGPRSHERVFSILGSIFGTLAVLFVISRVVLGVGGGMYYDQWDQSSAPKGCVTMNLLSLKVWEPGC